jgi:type II secretory pathway pseudopilin PulG
MKKLKLAEGGMTIVELVVAIVVSAVVIGSLSQVVTSNLHLSQRGRFLNLTNAYVEAKVESLRNNGYNSLPTGTTSLSSEMPSDLPSSKSGSMTVTIPQTGLKKVDITVSYKDQGKPYTYNYTTYVGELGVGQ